MIKTAEKLLLLSIFLFACRSKTTTASAKITERKFVNDSSIQITYSYLFEKQYFTDSLIVKNNNLSTDSLKITFYTDSRQKKQ